MTVRPDWLARIKLDYDAAGGMTRQTMRYTLWLVLDETSYEEVLLALEPENMAQS